MTTTATQRNLADWRETSLNGLLIGAFVLGLPAAIAGFWSAYQVGSISQDWVWTAQMAVVVASAYLTLFWLAWSRPFSYRARAGVFVGLLYCIGLAALSQAGLVGSGRLFLLAMVAFTGVLFGLGVGLGSLAVALLTLFVHAWLFVHAELALHSSVAWNNESPAVWSSTILSFAFLAGAILTSTAFLIKNLQTTVEERLQAESVLERYRGSLEELVDQRTTELEQSRKQLMTSERMASVGTLAAGIAHEINNPVAAILAAAQYARMCDGDGDDREIANDALGEIVTQAQRCGRIVRSVLQFSREEPTDKWPTEMNEILARTCTLTAGNASETGGSVQFKKEAGSNRVRLNPIEMEQVFINLIKNALQSRPDGGVHVVVSLRSDGEWVVVQVEDDGLGISQEQLARIFDPFYTTRQELGGTGLGLSVAHGIVREHGGEIDVSSEPGIGTSMWVKLPLDRSEEATAEG